MDIELPDISRQLSTLGKVAAFILAATAIAGGYAFYKNKIWRPSVKIGTVDWINQVADITINKSNKKLYSDSVLSAGGNWGVRFGFTEGKADRIELVQDNLVHTVFIIQKQINLNAASHQ